MGEASLRQTKNGPVPDGDGLFVLNARESRRRDGGPLGTFCTFEGKKRFPQIGINISVLRPGQPMAMYHRERSQEAFLVVAGECVLIVEGKERQLQTWDFVHCPPDTEHVIVGAGNEAAVVVAVGARGRGVAGGVEYRSAHVRRGTGPACSTKRPTPVRLMRARTPTFPGRSGSGTRRVGCQRTERASARLPGTSRRV